MRTKISCISDGLPLSLKRRTYPKRARVVLKKASWVPRTPSTISSMLAKPETRDRLTNQNTKPGVGVLGHPFYNSPFYYSSLRACSSSLYYLLFLSSLTIFPFTIHPFILSPFPLFSFVLLPFAVLPVLALHVARLRSLLNGCHYHT